VTRTKDRGVSETALHICIDLSPQSIRDHFAFVGDSSAVDALSDDDLAAAAREWLQEGNPEPWASYDRFCRMICGRAGASQPPVPVASATFSQPSTHLQRTWLADDKTAVVARLGDSVWELCCTECGELESIPAMADVPDAGASLVAAVARRHISLQHSQAGSQP